jgi:hypothetical protein
MTRTRVALVTGGLIAGILFAQSIVMTLWGLGFEEFANAVLAGSNDFQGGVDSQALLAGLPLALFFALIDRAAFGFGVFLSLRFVRRMDEDLTWKQFVLRAALATAVGAVVVLFVQVLETVLRSVTAGPYPFGYSFTPTFDSAASQTGLLNAFGGVLGSFVYNVPLVILVCVFLNFWLGARPERIERLKTALLLLRHP